MTVNEVIEILLAIENKELPLVIYTASKGAISPIEDIDFTPEKVYISIK